MSLYRLEIHVTPRPGLLDPEGQAIHHAVQSVGFEGVEEVRVGKAIYMEVEADSASGARDAAEAMCAKLLANPVTEDYEINLLDETPDGEV